MINRIDKENLKYIYTGDSNNLTPETVFKNLEAKSFFNK